MSEERRNKREVVSLLLLWLYWSTYPRQAPDCVEMRLVQLKEWTYFTVYGNVLNSSLDNPR